MNPLCFFLLGVLFLFIPESSWSWTDSGLPDSGFQKGIALGLYSKDPAYTYEQELKEIRATGADHVSLVVSWYQKDIRSNTIYPKYLSATEQHDNVTTPDAQLTGVIDQAHQLGLKVFLFPILCLEERKGKEWRGDLKPVDPVTWWKSYNHFTLSYAKLAQEHGVELYSVGSELCSQEPNNREWRRLIKEVRDVYRGKLLYSANWDHYQKIGFWRDLDFLGLNGYYKLASHHNPTLNELIARWNQIREKLIHWQDLYNRPIILTELGYPSMDGASEGPWDYSRQAKIDLEEQALCYEAFFRVWGIRNQSSDKRLGGVYFWNWYGDGGPEDRGYTPRNKPAEQVLTQWFQNFLPSPSSVSASSPAAPTLPMRSPPVGNRS